MCLGFIFLNFKFSMDFPNFSKDASREEGNGIIFASVIFHIFSNVKCQKMVLVVENENVNSFKFS